MKKNKKSAKKKTDADDKKSFIKDFNKKAPSQIKKLIAKDASGKTS